MNSDLNPRNSYQNVVLQLSIIIVNFNVKYFLELCLHSLVRATASIGCEIFVIDNNSTDGSKSFLQNKFPQVIFKWRNDNIGFGKASNSVLVEAKGKHILFLNPDTVLPEDCLVKSLRFFEQHPDCGALGVRMIDGAGNFLKESKRGLPSPEGSLYKMAGLAKLFSSSKSFAQYYAGHLPEKQNNPVEVLAGAFMMLSKKAILETGGFDEDFFMYGEDIDLSQRIRKAGMTNYYFAETTIIHFKGESTQKQSDHYIEHFYGAMELFIKKHYSENKKLLRSMTAAIKASKTFAKLKRPNRKQQAPVTSMETAIVASQHHFNECVDLVKHARPPVMLVGRIAANALDRAPSIGHMGQFPGLIPEKKIAQVIFSESTISFKEIIAAVEQCRNKATFLFHAGGSESIVGSNDKNSRGIFIAPADTGEHSPTNL